ncbi:TerD family protein [Streptomyces melanogenes]|uniref:TerD family protein n=1 Tax=Streptomyces melanogenes TaxID=67326 RepID=UPI00167C86F8|nr:TerD family protein [Streptomyces melanogenes]GGP66255.1 TerD-family protein [Streptomyces melanogenes]
MSGFSKGLDKVEVALRWDPSPVGSAAHDLDVIAAVYTASDPYGSPAYLVHFDSRSPDGTVYLSRDSTTGKGFGDDEVLTLEFARQPDAHARIVVGVVIQQRPDRLVFADVANPEVRIREGYRELASDDFSSVAQSTAATVAEFVRTSGGAWELHQGVRGFDLDPDAFTAAMGARTV